jgi:hypothetical protein
MGFLFIPFCLALFIGSIHRSFSKGKKGLTIGLIFRSIVEMVFLWVLLSVLIFILIALKG